MKNAVIFALVTTVATTTLTGWLAAPVSAQTAHSSQQSDAHVKVTVIIIREYVGPDDFQQVPRTYRYPSAQTLARAQEEIRSNAAIRAILQRRGVSFRNVVGVQTAFNGGKIVYVR